MGPTVDIIIPVYNEEKDLPRSVDILSKFLSEKLSEYPWRIVIADNGSTDGTLAVGEMLSSRYTGVSIVHIPQKGRGRALKQVWMESSADIVAYMDVDLSTDLVHVPQLVHAVEEGAHIAIGSRLMKGSRVTRSFKREFISRSYSTLIRAMFWTPFRDAQCGFKAVSKNTVKGLGPSGEGQRVVLRLGAADNGCSQRIQNQGDSRPLGRRPRQPRQDNLDGLGGHQGFAAPEVWGNSEATLRERR